MTIAAVDGAHGLRDPSDGWPPLTSDLVDGRTLAVAAVLINGPVDWRDELHRPQYHEVLNETLGTVDS